MASQPNQIAYGTNSPAINGDANYWQTGDIVINNNPSTTLLSGQNIFGWVCTAAGYPGTWIPMFTESSSQTLLTTATSGTLANGYRVYLLNPATTGTYSLPEASQNASGAFLTFKNIASGSVTLTPLATDNYDAAAITLAQNAAVTIFSNNTTTWYKQA